MSKLKGFLPIMQQLQSSIYDFAAYCQFEPTDQQLNGLDLVQYEASLPLEDRKKRIAISSGQGCGKSSLSALIGLWRVIQIVKAFVVVTAPTMRQCNDVWMKEARQHLSRTPKFFQSYFRIDKSKITVANDPDWAIKCVTATKPENMQGYHNPMLTFIVEEASGVGRDIIEQIKGTVTNKDALFFQIGNPNKRDCAFFDCFNSQRHSWHTLTYNAEHSPLVDPQNLKLIEEEYGRDSDVYRVRVLGQFPDVDPNCVIDPQDLEACADPAHFYSCLRLNPTQKAFGLDFARYGNNESAIYRRSGNAIVEHKMFAHTDPGTVLDTAFRWQAEAGWKNEDCIYIPDAGGIGQGLLHRFYQANKQVFEFHSGGSSSSQEYANRMTEAWFNVARLAKKRLIAIPRDQRLIHQLSTRQYTTRAKDGKLIIESKDDYIKRQVGEEDSPDRADAFVMCFYSQTIAESQSTSTNIASQRPGMRVVI